MPALAVLQDLTLFDPNDDESPLLGTYAGGVVTDPSFSTSRTHARPYLKFTPSVGGSAVDFAEGSGVIAQVTVDVVDKRRTANDQGTGLFTWLLAASNGDTALLGARAILRQVKWDGVTMGSAIDGTVYSVKLITEQNFVTYRLVLRDIRERERKVRLFVGATSTCVFPLVGPASGYGYNTQWNAATQDYVDVGSPAMPAISGLKAKVLNASGFLSFQFTDPNGPNGYFSIPPADYPLWEGRTQTLKPVWDLVGKIQPLDPTNTTLTPDGQYNAPGAIIDWSATSKDGPWTTITQPFVPVGLRGYTSILQIFPEDWDQKKPLIPHQIVIANPSNPALRPANGATVWVRIRSNRAPTADVPLWLETRFGDLLQDIYDGGYSYAGLGMKMRYSSAAMTAFRRATGKALVKITEPVEDAKPWIQENIYRANGYAPAIRDGVVYPVSGDLPDSALVVPTLDDSNVYPGEAEWEHGSELIVNHGEFLYERDLVPSNYSKTGTIITQQVLIQRDNGTSQARHNSKPISFQPVTVRAVSAYDVNMSQHNPDASQEDAARRGLQRISAAIRRFANGAQKATATCRASLTESIQAGDWVLLGVSWMPDYVTRRRGINRLMQVVNVELMEPHKRRFTLIDAGPEGQPVALPTAVSTVENADHSLAISVTGVPSTGKNPRAEVQLAYGEAQPASDSGEWKTVGFLDADGGVYVPTHPSGLNAWARVRGVADGQRSSVFRVASPLRMASLPGLREARLTINAYDAGSNPGYAHAEWEKLASAVGVRIYYEKFANGAAEPASLSNHIDVDATTLAADIVALAQWEQIVVQLEPWSAFGGGSVSGTQGPLSGRLTMQRRDRSYVAASVAVDQTRSGGTGTITLTATDPQAQITEYWFRHRSGNAGSWTSFVQDSSAPYADSVTIPAGQGSAIEYQVKGYASDGSVVVLQQEVIEFARVDNGPSLTVNGTPGDLEWSIDYSGVGTITYAIDGGSYSVPPGSPLTVELDSVSHVYSFKAVQDDQEIVDTVTVPARKETIGGGGPQITSISATSFFAPCDGGGAVDVSWTTSGMPGTEAYNVVINNHGLYGGSTQFFNKSPGDTLGKAFCSGDYGTINVRAEVGGTVIASQVFDYVVP